MMDKIDAEMEGYQLGRVLPLVVLVVVVLLAALVLAAVAGFLHEETLWMYVEVAKPTLLAP